MGSYDNIRQMVDEITMKAEGVFLWVSLVVKDISRSLTNADTFADLQRRISELPIGLKNYFQIMYDRLDEFYAKKAAKTFLLCLCSKGVIGYSRIPLLGLCVLEQDDSVAERVVNDHLVPEHALVEMVSGLVTASKCEVRRHTPSFQTHHYLLFRTIINDYFFPAPDRV